MKAREMRAMGTDELVRELDERHRELFNLRFQKASGQVENTARLVQVRREVARLATVLRERELLQEEGG